MYNILTTLGTIVFLLNGLLAAFPLVRATEFFTKATKALKDFNEGMAHAKKMRVFG